MELNPDKRSFVCVLTVPQGKDQPQKHGVLQKPCFITHLVIQWW